MHNVRTVCSSFFSIKITFFSYAGFTATSNQNTTAWHIWVMEVEFVHEYFRTMFGQSSKHYNK